MLASHVRAQMLHGNIRLKHDWLYSQQVRAHEGRQTEPRQENPTIGISAPKSNSKSVL